MRRFPHGLVVALVLAAGVVRGAQGLLYAGIVAAVVELSLLRFGLIDLRRTRWKRSAPPPRAPDALRRSFTQISDEMVAGKHSRREFDRGLRTRLTRILAVRLQERVGVALDAEPTRAEGIVDPELWKLLDPRRPAVVDRSRAGIGLPSVARIVDELEAL